MTPNSADPRQFIAKLPTELAQLVSSSTLEGGELVLAGRPDAAFEIFRRVYEQLLGAQPDGQRFHKGEPLHNMGWARFRSGLQSEGVRYTFLAFIEDALSRAEEQPGLLDELSRPAAANLLLVGVPETELLSIARRIRSLVFSGRLIRDPLELYVELRIGEPIRAVRPPVRLRVFVSSPSDLRPERQMVAEICRQLSLTMPAHVDALLWEGGGSLNPECAAFPGLVTGAPGQEIVDEHVWDRLGGYDVYLGMLYQRMGTPTGRWRSGTEAEFRYAFDRFRRGDSPRHLLFYRRRAWASRTDPEVTSFLADLRRIGALINAAGYDHEQLRRAIFSDLVAIVREYVGAT